MLYPSSKHVGPIVTMLKKLGIISLQKLQLSFCKTYAIVSLCSGTRDPRHNSREPSQLLCCEQS